MSVDLGWKKQRNKITADGYRVRVKQSENFAQMLLNIEEDLYAHLNDSFVGGGKCDLVRMCKFYLERSQGGEAIGQI